MKLLIDMNLSPLWVPFLADSGFESIHWSNIGQPSAPDTERRTSSR
jgi:predicted nuclease of predicted toxin-antitoxin system